MRSSYSKYSKQPSASGLTGAQVARVILDRNGLSNVRVEPVAGQLTDHYDPRSKVVRLSEGNFQQRLDSRSERGGPRVRARHPGRTGYLPMKLRSGLFPLVAFSSQIWLPLFIMGVFVGAPLFIQLAAILLGRFWLSTCDAAGGDQRFHPRLRLLTRYGMLSRDGGRRHQAGAVLRPPSPTSPRP